MVEGAVRHDRCQALGVARVLDPLTADTSDIREAALRALHDPAMRAAAHRVRDDAGALPDASHAAMLIEALPRLMAAGRMLR
jgi:UDP:flavonoid glycosyltransferase YjiC (YdhE family)